MTQPFTDKHKSDSAVLVFLIPTLLTLQSHYQRKFHETAYVLMLPPRDLTII